jgi:UrcA family protein
MSFVNRHMNGVALRIGSGLKPASCVLGLLAVCAVASAAFLTGREGSAFPPPRSARVSLAGLDLSTPDGVHDARERIRNAARELCARNLGQPSFDWCVHDIMAAAGSSGGNTSFPFTRGRS